jgi:putative flippase GtrA
VSSGERTTVAAPRPARAGSARLIAELNRRRGARFVVVGGSVYAFELTAIFAAQRAGMGPVTAVAVSYWLGLLLSFTFQKVFTFRDTRTHHRVVLPQLAAFSALVVFNFGFTILMTKLLQHDLPVVVVRTLALGVTTIWNFYLYKTRVFKAPIFD